MGIEALGKVVILSNPTKMVSSIDGILGGHHTHKVTDSTQTPGANDLVYFDVKCISIAKKDIVTKSHLIKSSALNLAERASKYGSGK